MSTQQNREFIHRYFEAMTKDSSPATIDEYVADEELKRHIETFQKAFPHYTITAEDVIAEGDKVVVRGTFHGRHTGDLMGIPPTGREVTSLLMIIYRIADGKIVEHWIVTDQLGLMQQLGVIPPQLSA